MADQVAPARREQQRPLRLSPAGQVGVGDEAARPPGVEHRADRLARDRGRGRRRWRRGTPRRGTARAGRSSASSRGAGTAARRRDDRRCGRGRRPRSRWWSAATTVGRGVRRRSSRFDGPAALAGCEAGDRLDELVALAADGVQLGRPGQRLEEERAARAGRRHDDHGTLDPARARRRRRRRGPAGARHVGVERRDAARASGSPPPRRCCWAVGGDPPGRGARGSASSRSALERGPAVWAVAEASPGASPGPPERAQQPGELVGGIRVAGAQHRRRSRRG